MLVRILGPLDVRSLSLQPQPPQPPRRRARLLVGALALRANQAVSTGWLTEVLWGGRPPQSAAANLRSYVAYARRLLSPSGDRDDGDRDDGDRYDGDRYAECASVEHVGSRYVLRIAPTELDALVFRALVAEARDELHEHEPALAAERLSRALGLWRGPVLDPVPLPVAVESEVDFLRNLRLDALEYRAEARLALGEHEALVGDLRGLVAKYPFREQLWRHLLVALYRSGRQVEALEAYATLHRKLDRELGVAPTASLQQVHHRILRSDPSLDVPGSVAGTPTVTATAGPSIARSATRVRRPHELPPAVHHFTGRARQLDLLSAIGLDPDRPPAVVVAGPPRSGTSSLVLHWAHHHVDEFSDGQVYLDLAAYGCTARGSWSPLVTRVLTALGEVVPLTLTAPQLEAVYRSVLAERRVLVVVDNVSSAPPVRSLLPGSTSSLLVLATSWPMHDLVARGEADRILVEPLTPDESYALLVSVATSLGRSLRAGDRPVVTEAVRLCRGEPLALRRLAELIARCDGQSLARVVAAVHREPSLVRGGAPVRDQSRQPACAGCA